jgi:radical SAM-linked protein
LLYAVSGASALTGHLDFVRALPRVMRRAELSAYYSEGFHPKPVMEFSPPLPLGVASRGEIVDLALAEEVPPEDLLSRLNRHAPDGLEFLAAERMGPGSRKLSRELAAADYLVRLETVALPQGGLAGADLDAAPARFLARESVLWDTTRKGEDRRVDLRPAVMDVHWAGSGDADEVPGFARAGARYLAVRLRLDAPIHARPEEVAAATLGCPMRLGPVDVARMRLWRRDGEGLAPILVAAPAIGAAAAPR